MLQELDSAVTAWVIIALCTQQHFTPPYSNYSAFCSLRLSLCFVPHFGLPSQIHSTHLMFHIGKDGRHSNNMVLLRYFGQRRLTTIEKKIPDILQISAGVTEDVLYSGDVWHVCKLMKHTYSSVRDNCFFKEMQMWQVDHDKVSVPKSELMKSPFCQLFTLEEMMNPEQH